MAFEAKPFGELFRTSQKNGLTRPKKVRGSGLPMVNMGELFAHARIRNIEMDLVPVSDAESSFLLEPGDLLFARQSLVRSGAGQCSIFLGNTKATVFESHLIRCRLRSTEFNPLFYYYFFRSPIGREVMDTIIEQGAGASGIRGSDLVKLPVPCPPKDDQDQIAESLNALDNKIALLRETNATLEAIAQALFKSWFVDFDPVRAKAEGRDPEGVPPEVADLFPSEFEDSELGAIPKGFLVAKVRDLGEVICGKTPSTAIAENFGGEVPFITIPDMHGRVVVTNTSRCLSSQGADSQSNKYLPKGSICVSCIATPGLVAMTSRRSQTNQQINSVIPKSKLGRAFPFLVLREIADSIRARGSGGSVFTNLSKGGFETIRITLPTPDLVTVFNQLVEPIHDQIESNQIEAENLSDLRDTLLPRLMSGKLRIPDVEKVFA